MSPFFIHKNTQSFGGKKSQLVEHNVTLKGVRLQDIIKFCAKKYITLKATRDWALPLRSHKKRITYLYNDGNFFYTLNGKNYPTSLPPLELEYRKRDFLVHPEGRWNLSSNAISV